LRKSTITFNYRIVDGHIEFPYYMLLFDKSNKQSTRYSIRFRRKQPEIVRYQSTGITICQSLCKEEFKDTTGVIHYPEIDGTFLKRLILYTMITFG
jgi:hypothetical protein